MIKHTPMRPQGFFSAHAAQAAPLLRMPQRQLASPSKAAKTMVNQLRATGIVDEEVLAAMLAVPRHVFVDATFAARAYDNVALPIGYQQTISQPWIVARMLGLALQAPLRLPKEQRYWLEIGTGCGYQAAVMAHCAAQVCSIERIEGLHHDARRHLNTIAQTSVQLHHGDGAQGWGAHGQNQTAFSNRFNAIVVAAAGIDIAPAWLQQLAIGGRLVAPVGGAQGVQKLNIVDRISANQWQRSELDAVQFVPLLGGVA